MMNSAMIEDCDLLFAHVLSIHPEANDVICEFTVQRCDDYNHGRTRCAIYHEPDKEAAKVAGIRYWDWEVYRWDNMAHLQRYGEDK